MKSIISLCLFATLSVALSAQDKQLDFEAKNDYIATMLVAGSSDCFYLLGSVSLVNAELFKFDAELKPVWKEPVSVKGSFERG